MYTDDPCNALAVERTALSSIFSPEKTLAEPTREIIKNGAASRTLQVYVVER
jgi:hypothetical protein